ncbi:DUF4097 family beta strand repeat-containing protein [Streptomyces sp. NPDC056144]|uniref:DUF4097 family beta strand repeat-containing protein n=1 Tax=unclassified Streptomyces TaxID=2593676 RepID=UPI0035DCD8D5
MQKFATTAPILAVLDIPAGRIQLIAADRSDATVDVRPAVPGKGRDEKAAEQITVSYADGVLRVEAAEPKNQLFGATGSVEVTVQLPAGSRVEAKAAAADLRGVGRLGDVAFDGAQATVKLDETAGARVTVQDGTVTIGRLGGHAEISTQKGDIRIAEAVRGAVALRTEHGDIAVGAARGTSATLDAGTAYGRVENALMNTVGAGAELALTATTSYGDITARSL